ncbi:MAG TPA: lytic transglycosylase domain-containing protein [Gallionella sp.]|nr:lytic transglycosylase domain-containing protein [Gallionella sp.]
MKAEDEALEPMKLGHLLKILLEVVVVSCMVIADAHADIFMFTDDSGTPHISDVRSDPRYRLFSHTEEQAGTRIDASQAVRSIDNANRESYSGEIRRAASLYHVDEQLLHAVIRAESGYRPNIVSSKGAVGLMQLMPETARRYNVTNSFDPAQNIHAGARYLSSLLVQFDNNIPLALAAYNAGEDNVRRYGGRIPPFPETMAYVPRVMDLYRRNMRMQR